MSVKDRLRRKVQSFHESDIECPDEDALLELVEAAEKWSTWISEEPWEEVITRLESALRRITEDS